MSVLQTECADSISAICSINAGVMELVDMTDSKSVGSNIVRVRSSSPAPYIPYNNGLGSFLVVMAACNAAGFIGV